MIKKILLSIDGSKESNLAEDYAIDLAKIVNGEITAINVIDTCNLGYFGSEPFFPQIGNVPELIEAMKEESMKILNKFKKKAEKAKVNCEILSKTGIPWNEIVEESKNYDLIIIGSRGLTGINRFLLGSTAERVVRHSKCPVLVVKDKRNEI